MKKLLLFGITIFSIVTALAEAPNIEWKKYFGGSANDQPAVIEKTINGGYIIAGGTSSNDNDITYLHGGQDMWIVCTNSAGEMQWQKTYGGTGSEFAYSIKQTADGGFIVSGFTNSTNGDVTQAFGLGDCWVLKLAADGAIQWQKSYGGSGNDNGKSIVQTTDGGYIITGTTTSTNGDVTSNHGSIDYWVIKINATGTIEWQKTYGSASDDSPSSIKQTVDGGYIVAGRIVGAGGDILVSHGNSDCWVVKLDNLGNITWQKTLGGSSDDSPADGYAIEQCADGGYIVGVSTYSNDKDVTNNHGKYDGWIVKLDITGAIEWQKTYGTDYQEFITKVHQTSDGGYAFVGYTYIDAFQSDTWIVKLSSAGIVEWEKSVVQEAFDVLYSFQETTDGFILTGSTNEGYEVGYGGHDIGLLKLTSGVLPIQLIDFTAANNNENILISWKTVSEVDDSYYRLQRSADGVHFSSIATIKAATEGSATATYSYTDKDIRNLNTGHLYYRLQQVKKDGGSGLSKTILLRLTNAAFEAQIVPNPITTRLNLSVFINKNTNASILITDASGRKILADNKKLVAAANNFNYNTSSWQTGYYFIKISLPDGSIITKRIIKQ